MRVVTSATVFRDAVGMRLSVTYSEVDDTYGRVIQDNIRVDRVITDSSTIQDASSMLTYAQSFVDELGTN